MKRYIIPVLASVLMFRLLPNLSISSVQAATNESKFDNLIAKASIQYRVPMPLIKAIIRVESTFNSNAINAADPSSGLMQTTPTLASAVLGRRVTLNQLLDPELSIEAGTRFLKILINKYSLDTAIQSYNLGETSFRHGKRVPNYLAKVKKYMIYYA